MDLAGGPPEVEEQIRYLLRIAGEMAGAQVWMHFTFALASRIRQTGSLPTQQQALDAVMESVEAVSDFYPEDSPIRDVLRQTFGRGLTLAHLARYRGTLWS